MFLIASIRDHKTIFTHQIGLPLDLQSSINLIRQERWKSELKLTIYGHELDFLYQNGFIRNEGERIVQKKAMIGDIIKMVSQLYLANNSYLVA